MKLTKAEQEIKDRLAEGYELSFDWIAHKWSLRNLNDNGMLLFIRVNRATAMNAIGKLQLQKLPYDRGQRDRYTLPKSG